jgi:uncharacterized membrane protein
MSTKADILWNRLRQEGVVDGGMPGVATAESPWYVRVMLGVAGWIAAMFLLGFVAAGFGFLFRNEEALVIGGLVMLVVAYVTVSFAANDFFQQFGLAISIAGQVIVVLGSGELLGWHGKGIWWLIGLLQLVIAVAMPNFLLRLVAAFLAICALAIALEYYAYVASVLVALAIALIWLNEFTWGRWGGLLRPVGYGMTLALVCLKGSMLLVQTSRFWYSRSGERMLMIPPWVEELALGLLLVAVVARLMLRNNVPWGSPPMLITLLVSVAVAGVSLEVPGLAVGLLVVLLGFSNSSRTLAGLGIAALLFFLSAYYYNLQATLLVKSELLAATGVVLLSARWVLLKWVLPAKEASHA